MNYSDFSSRWSKLHGNATTTGIVGGWLRISFVAAGICTTLRITPNILTFLGVLCAGFTAATSPHWWCAVLLAFSLFFDGIDGSVAIIQNRASKLGATWDGLADRISEALWAVAFYRLGVPLSWVLIVSALAAFQEYARARMGSLGVHEVGVVTPAERPVRASFLFCAIVAPHAWATTFAIALGLLQALSFFLVVRFAFRKLR